MALARGAEARFLRPASQAYQDREARGFSPTAPEFTTKTHWRRGTEGSNPPPSSAESSANRGPRSSGPPAGKDQRGLHIGVNGGYVGLQSTRSARGAARQGLGFFLIFLNDFNCNL
jgi:hypothetical protein